MIKDELVQGIIEDLAKCQRPALTSGWKKLGLSHAQVGMLFLLSYHQDSSVKDVSDFLGISKSAVTQLMSPLIDRGFVNRSEDAKDRRIVRLSLTAKGSAELKKLAKHKYAGLRSRLEGLSTGDLRTLADLCHKLTPETH